MADNTLKIGAEVNLLDLNARMNEGAEAVRSSIDKMLVSFQEASTGSARAVSRITEDTRAGAVAVSDEWTRVAQSTLVYNAALKEVSAATYLARKAGEDDASATLLLASAKQKAALAARELAEAEKAVAVSAEDAAGAEGLLGGALMEFIGPLIGLEILRRRIDDTANFEIKMRNLSLTTGISAQSLAGLHDVVKEMGGDFDAIAAGLSKMERSQQLATEGQKQSVDGFKRLGISVQEVKALSPEELLYRVAQGFNDTGSSAEKNTAAVELFGKGGRALIPVFTELGDQLQEHVQKAGAVSGVTERNIEAAQQYKVVVEQLEIVMRNFVAYGIGPLLTGLNWIGAAFEAVGGIVDGVLDLIGAFGMSVVHAVVGAADVVYDTVTGDFNAISSDSSDASSKIKSEWTGAADDIKKSWEDVVPALLHPFEDLKNLGSLPKIPSPTGEGDAPGAGGGADKRLAKWREELQAKKDAEISFHQLSKNEEADFWEAKLALTQKGSKLYAQVHHKMRQAQIADSNKYLKDEIEDIQIQVAATKTGSLERVTVLSDGVARIKALGADQTEDYRRLQKELAVATKDYAEEQAKAVVQADRQKVESARKASEERVAAERKVLEDLKGKEGTAAYTAQLKAVAAAELAAHNEKIKLHELDIEQEKIAAQSVIEVRRQQVQTDFDLHRINGQQRIALLKTLENQEYEVQKEALQKKLTLLENDPTISPVQLKQIQNQIENLTREHNNKISQLNTQAVKESQQKYDQFFGHINSGFTSALNGMLTGHQSFMRGLMNLWSSGVEYIIDKIAMIGLKWFEQHVLMAGINALFHTQEQTAAAAAQSEAIAQNAATNLAMSTSDAAVAAAGTFAYYSAFAPEIAPAMAAAAYGEGMAWAALSAFHLGGISDTEQLAVLKRNEMVLPPVLSAGFQNLLGNGAPAASPGYSGHRIWTGDMHINGVGDPQAVADLAFEQMQTFFHTGGVHRR